LTLNSEYPQAIFTTVSGFAMDQDTAQPQETINLLVDMLFGSEENYLECWLGSSNNYTQNSDGTITVKMVQDSEGNYEIPAMPNLTGGLSDIFPYSEADILYSQNGVVTTGSDTENYNAIVKMLNDSLENGSAVEIPVKYQIIESATCDANLIGSETSIYNLYAMCFSEAIMKNSYTATVQQIIDEYKAAMLALGGNAMLDEMNAAIGKTTAYYYD